MRWSEMKTENFYMPYDENQRVIRGFFLRTLNLDLNLSLIHISEPTRP